jgi:chromosome segregation ATPase
MTCPTCGLPGAIIRKHRKLADDIDKLKTRAQHHKDMAHRARQRERVATSESTAHRRRIKSLESRLDKAQREEKVAKAESKRDCRALSVARQKAIRQERTIEELQIDAEQIEKAMAALKVLVP